MNNEIVPSLTDLMEEAFKLSMKLCHSELDPDGYYLTPRKITIGTEEQDEMVWAWCDGLVHRHYEKVSSGHCSLQTTIDFDVEKFEDEVKENIITMKKLLEQYGPPIILTKEEMTRRGYKGY